MDDLIHSYAPQGAAAEVFHCRAPELVISGPAGTGKSRGALEKMHLLASLNPDFRGLLIRKTLTSLTSTGLVTWRQHVAREALAAGEVAYYGGSSQEPASYRYANGARIVVGGMDRPTRVMSSEYDAAFVQEATELTETDWEALSTRLRNGGISFQQLMADCNPDTPTHWLLQRCNRGAAVMLNSRHEDNPVLYGPDGQLTVAGAAYMARLDALTGVRYQRLRLGLWVAAEGVIYDGWQPAVHLIDRFKIPLDWTRWWTVDFGYVHPLVIQCWAEDPDGRLYLHRELYATRTLVEDAARQMLEIVAPRGVWHEPKPRAVVTDHDAEDRATLARHLGLPLTPAKKAVSPGIQAVQARLRPAGDGKPRLFVLRDSLIARDPEQELAKKPCSTVEELPGYVWLPPAPGRQAKEEPLKEADDGCDALRYMVAHRDLGGRQGVRFVA
jgi:PBSX family phage terminase large subunit